MIPRSFTILIMLSLSLFGCSSAKESDQQVKGVVMRYTQLIAEGYAKMNMNPLQEVATVDQATKAYHHMAALGESKVRMLSSLKKMDFVEITFPRDGEAVVRTREAWDFSHRQLESDKVQWEEKDFAYLVTYELKKEGNRWLIHKLTATEEKPGGKGTSPPKKAPAGSNP